MFLLRHLSQREARRKTTIGPNSLSKRRSRRKVRIRRKSQSIPLRDWKKATHSLNTLTVLRNHPHNRQSKSSGELKNKLILSTVTTREALMLSVRISITSLLKLSLYRTILLLP
jgi:hypothetical protein